MNLTEIAQWIVSLGVGGAVGALAGLWAAGSQTKESFDRLSAAVRALAAERTDARSNEALTPLEDLAAKIVGLAAGFDLLRRALKRR